MNGPFASAAAVSAAPTLARRAGSMRALLLIALLSAGVVPAPAASPRVVVPARDVPFLTGTTDPAAFEKAQAMRLAAARDALARLLAAKGRRTLRYPGERAPLGSIFTAEHAEFERGIGESTSHRRAPACPS